MHHDSGDGDARSNASGRSRRALLAAAGTAGAGLLAGCLGGGSGNGGAGSDDGGTATPTGTDGSMDDGSTATGTTADGSGGASWRSIELSTVRGDETFTIEGLEPPVVVQSFAVWCPKCQRQSNQLSDVTDSATVLGLNTDPNEDAAKVRQHAEENGFGWRFAVAPAPMIESLVDEFGPTVTNAPSTPIILVCGDGTAEFSSGSIRSAADIESAAREC